MISLVLQSDRPTLLLLRDQRAAAEQPEVPVLGGVHRKSTSLTPRIKPESVRKNPVCEIFNVRFPLRWISVINCPDSRCVQVPLELESPTQISLVDEASGEVKTDHLFTSSGFNKRQTITS